MSDQTVPAPRGHRQRRLHHPRFNAPIDVVWRFWTEPELTSPSGSGRRRVHVDPRPSWSSCTPAAHGISTWSTTRAASTTRSRPTLRVVKEPEYIEGIESRGETSSGPTRAIVPARVVPRPRRQDAHHPAPGTLHARVPRHDRRGLGGVVPSRSTRSSRAAPREREKMDRIVAGMTETPRQPTAPGSRSSGRARVRWSSSSTARCATRVRARRATYRGAARPLHRRHLRPSRARREREHAPLRRRAGDRGPARRHRRGRAATPRAGPSSGAALAFRAAAAGVPDAQA